MEITVFAPYTRKTLGEGVKTSAQLTYPAALGMEITVFVLTDSKISIQYAYQNVEMILNLIGTVRKNNVYVN